MNITVKLRDPMGEFNMVVPEGVSFRHFCRQMVQSGGIENFSQFYPLTSIDTVFEVLNAKLT